VDPSTGALLHVGPLPSRGRRRVLPPPRSTSAPGHSHRRGRRRASPLTRRRRPRRPAGPPALQTPATRRTAACRALFALRGSCSTPPPRGTPPWHDPLRPSAPATRRPMRDSGGRLPREPRRGTAPAAGDGVRSGPVPHPGRGRQRTRSEAGSAPPPRARTVRHPRNAREDTPGARSPPHRWRGFPLRALLVLPGRCSTPPARGTLRRLTAALRARDAPPDAGQRRTAPPELRRDTAPGGRRPTVGA
jgi:hypothetical protein